MIYLLREKVVSTQIQDMLERHENMIKIVVDIRRRVLSGGGEMLADVESITHDILGDVR